MIIKRYRDQALVINNDTHVSVIDITTTRFLLFNPYANAFAFLDKRIRM